MIASKRKISYNITYFYSCYFSPPRRNIYVVFGLALYLTLTTPNTHSLIEIKGYLHSAILLLPDGGSTEDHMKVQLATLDFNSMLCV